MTVPFSQSWSTMSTDKEKTMDHFQMFKYDYLIWLIIKSKSYYLSDSLINFNNLLIKIDLIDNFHLFKLKILNIHTYRIRCQLNMCSF
jgi:hypothetical protein